jgi:hypothetical protein
MFQFEQRRYSEHAVSAKTAVRAQNMEVGMPSQKIAKRMHCHNGPRNGPLFRYGFPEEFLQALPSTAAEIGEQLPIIEEIAAQDFGYAEDEMPVRNGLEDFFTQPFPEFYYPFLMAGRTKVPSPTRKC